MPSFLLVLAQDAFIERQIGSLFCAQPLHWLRDRCLLGWRRSRNCGC
jgi:hypothetical protein